MQFDKTYYKKLSEFFQQNNNVTYNISDLADDTEKFVLYTKYYQWCRDIETEAEVVLSFDNKQLYIVEFFQNVLNSQALIALNAANNINVYNSHAQTPLGASIEPVITNSQPVHITVPVGFNAPVSQPIKKSPFPNK